MYDKLIIINLSVIDISFSLSQSDPIKYIAEKEGRLN